MILRSATTLTKTSYRFHKVTDVCSLNHKRGNRFNDRRFSSNFSYYHDRFYHSYHRIFMVCGGSILILCSNLARRDQFSTQSEEWQQSQNDDTESIASIKQYPANDPIEDRCHMERLSNGAWWFSVFDGHGGWQCSHYASNALHKNVGKAMAHFLGKDFSDEDDSGLYEDRIDRKLVSKALKSAFERTDRQYMVKVAGAFELGFGRDTRAGSCALGALVFDGVLFVCNAGDSRAVLAVNRSEYVKALAPISNKPSHRTDIGLKSRTGAEADVNGWNIDEFMGQAALKDSIGEELSPEVAEALRNRLLHQIYELKQAEKTSEEQKNGEENPDKLYHSNQSTPEDKEIESSTLENNKNPFVNVVRMLTGGKTEIEEGANDKPQGFVAIDMSNDHNCREPLERKALERAHPQEKDVVICRKDSPDQCYIKGKLQPTRAFGDYYLKFPEFMRDAGQDDSSGRYVPPPYTPPYITASPEVQIRTLHHGVDEFLVMATDGLWDLMTSQEAIDIAGDELRKPGGTPGKACVALSEEVLCRAANLHGLTLQELKALRLGRNRRCKHDDISVIVVDLSKLVDLHYWG